jgi:cytochrome d ubiquinol oxidase subunit I
MRTADSVTPMPNLVIPFVTFTILYIFLAFITAWLLLKQVAESPDSHQEAKNPEQETEDLDAA